MKRITLVIILIAFLVDYGSTEPSSCDPEHSTVCSFTNGTNTCCPIKDGTCCSDVNFCCPKGKLIPAKKFHFYFYVSSRFSL